MTFFLVRREDMGALLEVRKAYVDGVRPAVTTVFVAGLVPAGLARRDRSGRVRGVSPRNGLDGVRVRCRPAVLPSAP